MAEKKKTLLLIDSFALIFRAYYAFPPNLTTSSGELINAVYGFASLLLDVLLKFEPTHVVAVFDSEGPTIRSQEFSEYKANRKDADPEFLQQIPRVRELLETFKIPVLNVEGYEADDVIGTINKKYSGDWAETIIVTGDQDIFQLVDSHTSVYLAGRRFSQSKLFKAEDVKEKLEITPEQVIDYKALCGDPSDNIPGIKGIGKKTAVKLLSEYGDLETIFKNADTVKGAVGKKLQNGYEIAMKSQKLATIETNVPVTFTFEHSLFETIPVDRVRKHFAALEFKSLLKKLDSLTENLKVDDNVGLFDTVEEEGGVELKVFDMGDIANLAKSKSLSIVPRYENEDVHYLDVALNSIEFQFEGETYHILEADIPDFIQGITEVPLVLFNSKLFLHGLQNLEISTGTLKVEDLGIAAYLLGGGRVSHELANVLDYLGLDGAFNKKIGPSQISLAHTEVTTQLNDMVKIANLYDIEMQVLQEVVEMEREGIYLEKSVLIDFMAKLDSIASTIESEIFKIVGHEFNISSPKQVGEVLFDEMELPGARKTKSGQYSTNERVLNNIRDVDPVIEKILTYREVKKLSSTYVSTLPGYARAEDGRVHSTFDQLGAVSGRFSSNDPNLQNIPSNNSVGINIRSAFRAEKGNTFVAFDYSQQELRMLAAFAEEPDMIESFKKGEDIHARTASEMFDVPVADVTKEQRNIGKTINFSVVYGISAFGLSDRLRIHRDEAQTFIDAYYKEYPAVENFFEKMKIKAKKQGYLETVMGRRRYSEGVTSSNRFRRQAAEREMLNFTIQGSAADVMKKAMIEIREPADKYGAKLLLQIHDEFLFEINQDADINQFIKEIKDVMENVHDIGVPYKVDAKVGPVWGEMEEINNYQ